RVRGPDASAHGMHTIHAEVVQKCEVVLGVGVPAVARRHSGGRAAGIALVHRDDRGLVRHGDPRGYPWHGLARGTRAVPPELGGGRHTSRGEENERISRAGDLVVKRGAGALKYWHGGEANSIARGVASGVLTFP